MASRWVPARIVLVVLTALALTGAAVGCGAGNDGDPGRAADSGGTTSDGATGDGGGGGSSGAAAPAPDPKCRDDDDTRSTTTTVAYAQVRGVDPNLLSMDVHRPAGCDPAPVLFWVHGGAWRAGDKADEATATKVAWAAEHGWAVVAVNYRLTTDSSGVRWPTQGEDTADAVAYALAHADELGLDPDRVALLGHSAGAHIAAMLAVDPDLLGRAGADRSAVDCLVALDTEGYDLARRLRTGSDVAVQVYRSVFGTDPADLAAASPTRVVDRTGGPVPDAVVVTRGTPDRVARAGAFADALRRAGGTVEVVDATGYTHAEVNRELGRADDPVVTPPVTAFLERCLASP